MLIMNGRLEDDNLLPLGQIVFVHLQTPQFDPIPEHFYGYASHVTTMYTQLQQLPQPEGQTIRIAHEQLSAWSAEMAIMVFPVAVAPLSQLTYPTINQQIRQSENITATLIAQLLDAPDVLDTWKLSVFFAHDPREHCRQTQAFITAQDWFANDDQPFINWYWLTHCLSKQVGF